MSGLELWISENIWTFLIAGLALSAAVAAAAVWSGRRAWVRARSRAGSWWGLAVPLVLFFAAAIGLVFFGSGSVVMGPELAAQGDLVGRGAPEVRFARVGDAAEATLAEHRGSVVLVNLWATWCPPCRHEMPALDRLQQAYGDRGLVVLQLSDEPREVIAEYLESAPMSTLHGYVADMPLPDPGRPTSYVIDREGVVRRVILGPRSYEQFEAEIQPLL